MSGIGGFGGFEVALPAGRGREFVGAGCQPGQLGGPVIGGGGRQIGFLIPAEHGGGGLDHGELTGFFENRHGRVVNQSLAVAKLEMRWQMNGVGKPRWPG